MGDVEVQQPDTRSGKPAKLIIFLVVSAAIVIFLYLYVSFINRAHRSFVLVGDPAPAFTFPSLDGKTVSLADYKGKVVFVNIWATWCPPCREEMPSMEKLYRQLKGEDIGKDFEILAISVDSTGAKDVGPFMEKLNLTFPALLDPRGTIQDLYGTTGLPESYIIGRDGIIEKIVIGPLDWTTPQSVQFFRDLLRRPLRTGQ